MPSSTGVCSCSRLRPILPRPSARSVPRWRSLWPIWLLTCVIFTFATLLVVLLLADAAPLRLRLHSLLGSFRGRLLGDRRGLRLRARTDVRLDRRLYICNLSLSRCRQIESCLVLDRRLPSGRASGRNSRRSFLYL